VNLSVVMTVRNGEPYLPEAVESVLAQSVADFEFLIVDDASTDNTPGILSAYQAGDSRIRVLRNESHLGHCPSANRGLLHASGHFIARHDADDISLQERFAIQLDAVQSAPEVSLATGQVEFFGERASAIHRPPAWQPRLEWELLFGNAVGAGAHVMFPRLFRGSPVLYSAKYFWAEDYALWRRLSQLGRVVCPAQVIYRYRRHPLSITSRREREQEECAATIRYEYQSEYLRPAVSRETAAELSRFWRADGSRPLAGSISTLYATLADLRAGFLAYVEQRYGLTDRARLEAEIDKALGDRLGYWLFRSLRFQHGNACRALLSIARARREILSVSANAFALAAGALARRAF
jgi:Glycosyl transferase family 2